MANLFDDLSPSEQPSSKANVDPIQDALNQFDSDNQDDGIFGDLATPNSEAPSSSILDDLAVKPSYDQPSILEDLDETKKGNDKAEWEQIGKDVLKGSVANPFMTPLDSLKAMTAIGRADEKVFGDVDPVKFRTTDFIPTPMRIATTIGKAFDREESALATPVKRAMQGDLNVGKNFMEGLRGEATSEHTGDLVKIGDIFRDLGLPEPVAATLGLSIQSFVPSSVLLSRLTPALKVFGAAEDVAKNAVARQNLTRMFNDSAKEWKQVRQGMIDMLAPHMDDTQKQNFARALKEIDLMSKDLKGKQAVRIFNRFEDRVAKGAAVQAEKKPSMMDNLQDAYLSSLTPQRVVDTFDGFQNYKGWRSRVHKALNTAETKGNFEHNKMTAELMDEWEKAGIQNIDEESSARMQVARLMQEGKEREAQALMKAKGWSTVPELNAQEKTIVDSFRRIYAKLLPQVKKAWKTINGDELAEVENYAGPLKYQGDGYLSPMQEISQNFRRAKFSHAEKALQERETSGLTPSADFVGDALKGIADHLHFANLYKQLHGTRQILAHPVVGKKLGEVEKKWWIEYLSQIENHGHNARKTMVDSLLQGMRRNLSDAVMGYKLSSIMVQPFAFFDAMAYTSAKHGGKLAREMAHEVGKTWLNPKYAREVIGKSKALTTRQGGEFTLRERMGELKGTALGKLAGMIPGVKDTKLPRLIDEGLSQFMTKGYQLLQEADVRTAAGTQSAFQKMFVREGMNPAEASKEADYLMNLLAGSADVTNRPLVAGGGEFQKLWLMFQTFVMNRWSMMAHDFVADGLINAGKQRQSAVKAAEKAFSNPDMLPLNLKTQQYAVLSAEKSTLDPKVNAKRTKGMIKELREMGFKPIQQKGVYGGAPEQSFIVPGMTDDEALKLAAKYQQDSVLTPRGILYYDGTMSPANIADMAIETVDYADEGVKKYHDLIEQGGGKFKGVQPGFTKKDGTTSEGLVLFDSPTGSTLALKPSQLTPEAVSAKVKANMEASGMTDMPGYSFAKIGGKGVRYTIPVDWNTRAPIDPNMLTKATQSANALGLRGKAAMALAIILAGQFAENAARGGIYKMTTGKDPKNQSFGTQLMNGTIGNIPIFGNILQGLVGEGGSSLPPVLRTLENTIRGVHQMATTDKDEMRARAALRTLKGGLSLTAGLPGTAQIFDLLERLVPKDQPKIKFRKSERQKMIDRLRRP